MKNGGKNKSVAFIMLFSVYIPSYQKAHKEQMSGVYGYLYSVKFCNKNAVSGQTSIECFGTSFGKKS